MKRQSKTTSPNFPQKKPEMTFDALRQIWRHEQAHAKHVLDDFAKEFVENAAYTFQWRTSTAIPAAAEFDTYATVQIWLTNAVQDNVPVDKFWAECKKDLINSALREVEHPTRSTSPTYDLLERCKAQARLRLVRQIERVFGLDNTWI